MLIEKFQKRGHVALQADGDADTLICNTTINIACKGRTFQVVGEDIDLLCILIAGTPLISADIMYFKPGKRKYPAYAYLIQEIQSKSPELKQSILFSHAASGCDMASAFFGKGKILNFKKVQRPEMNNLVEVFNNCESTKDEIFAAMCQYHIFYAPAFFEFHLRILHTVII